MSMLPYMLTHHRDHSEFVMSAERSPSALPRVEQDGRAAQVLHHHREYQHHQCQHHHQHHQCHHITNINNVDIITDITNVVSIVVCRSLSLGTSPVLTIEEAQRQDGGVRR